MRLFRSLLAVLVHSTQDLVLVEVRSGRLKLDTRLTGDPVRVQDDLRTLIVEDRGLVMVVVRGDHRVNDIKLANALDALGLDVAGRRALEVLRRLLHAHTLAD